MSSATKTNYSKMWDYLFRHGKCHDLSRLKSWNRQMERGSRQTSFICKEGVCAKITQFAMAERSSSSFPNDAKNDTDDVFYKIKDFQRILPFVTIREKYRSKSYPELSSYRSPLHSKVSETDSTTEELPPHHDDQEPETSFPIPTDFVVRDKKCHLISLIRRYDILVENECKQLICADYLTTSYEVTPVMRSMLVNWLYQVSNVFRLEPETFHNAICLVDCYLSFDLQFPRENLKLLGLTAIYIGSKKYDAFTLTTKKLVSMLGDKSVDDMQKMELKLLQTCFKIKPLSILMLKQLCKIGNVNRIAFTIASYIIDVAVQDHLHIGTKPSGIACAALMLTFTLMDNENGWNRNLKMCSGYDMKNKCLKNIMEELQSSCELNSDDEQLQAIRMKYLSNEFQDQENLIGVTDYIEKLWLLDM